MNRIIKKIFNRLPSSYVLMFHHIDDGKIIPRSGCKLSYERFLNILDSGLNFISIEQYLKFSFSNIGKCTITFDDNLQDVYRIAYPELKKRKIPFTIFVITDFLDTEGYISTDELIEMSENPLVTIASHGLSHMVLKNMECELQKSELTESKKVLEKITQKSINLFAYSHGQFDDYTIDLMRKLKCYDYAFGTSAYPTNLYTKHLIYNLPRLNCTDNGTKFIIKKHKNKSKLQLL